MGSSTTTVGNVFDASVQADADGKVTIEGDLTVEGTTTSIETVNLTVEDKLIELAHGTSGTPSGDAGIIVERGSSTNSALIWDESADTWNVCTTSATGSSTGDLTTSPAALSTAGITATSTTAQLTMKYDADSLVTVTVADGSNTTIATGETGDLILDAADDIILDSHAGKWRFKRNGTLTNMISATAADGSKMVFDNQVSNAGYDFKCSDGGVGITALSIDAANAGAATFNNKVTATELDISGDCDIDGTMEADAITVNGTALNTVIAGVTVTNATNAVNATNATNATNSAHVLVTDNESTAEENLITFVEGATSTTGNVGLEMDGHLTYNPSTGTVSATVFKGNIDAVDGDFDGTLEADAITVGGANLTTIYSPIAGSSSIVTTGALNAGSITSGFTSIDVGAGAISTTGTVTTGVVNSTVTAATGLSLDQNYSVTDASNTTCLSIDFDKTGTSTTNNTMIGINLDMDSTAATGGTNTMTGIKVTPTLTQASGSAQNFTIKGVEVIATGSASPEESVVRALDLISTGGDYNQGLFMTVDDGGIDIKLVSSADSGDHCTIATGAAGATTLTTTDNGGANADLTFSIDGSFDVTATSMSLSSDLTVTGGDITLGAAADANNTALVAVTESGTNIDGKTLTIGGGLGTGTGLPGSVSITSGIPGGSGSSAHNATTVATFSTFGPTLNYGGVDALANDESVGEKVFFGTGQTVKGKLYCLNTSGAWVLTDADAEATTAALIAVACGGDGTGSANDALTNGMLIRGFIDNASALTGTFNEGIPIYVDTATAGNMTVTRPSASGDFVRVVGWACATGNVIYFNPSNDYIEL